MKIQIRQGVFETNSSSMHALAMQKDFTLNCEQCKDKYKDLIPEHMTLAICDCCNYCDDTVYENGHWRDCTPTEFITNKINLVYSNIVSRISGYDQFDEYQLGYVNLTLFFGWLNKLGIKYDINYETRYVCDGETDLSKRVEVCVYEEMDDELFYHIYDGTEETFCNFLFGDGSKLDGYETDSMPDDYEKFENEFWDKLSNNNKCVTYSHYGG